MFISRNPFTTVFIREYEAHSDVELDCALDDAVRAFNGWRDTTLKERCTVLGNFADKLAAESEVIARAMTEEMGKPIAQARAEVDKSVLVTRVLLEQAPSALAPERAAVDEADASVRFDPLGVVLAIMPWNFPLNQVVRAAIPALLAGNTVLLKHAPNVQGSAELIEKLFNESFPLQAAYANIRASEAQLASLISDKRVAAVTLTGSERAGRAVAALAGEHLKPAVLELGGSDPFIVFEDADLDAVIPIATRARLQNSGQSCIAAKRFLVSESCYERFLARLTSSFESVKAGDPTHQDTEVGPLARLDLLKNLERQVEASLQAGAEARVGAKRASTPGYVYAPTVLANVQPGMAAFDEELFGPVASVTKFTDDDEALSLANQTSYGLGASMWTSNHSRVERFAGRLESGMVFCNDMVRSDPRVPFGGVKASGYGRELGSYGLRSFVNVKLDWRRGAA